MNDRGFTLIELVIGLLILGVGLMAIAGMQITSAKENYFSSNLTQATLLAQDRLEQINNLPFASLRSGQDRINLSGLNFIRKVTVDSSALGGSSTMAMITVTVSWTDPSEHNISFSTIKAQE